MSRPFHKYERESVQYIIREELGRTYEHELDGRYTSVSPTTETFFELRNRFGAMYSGEVRNNKVVIHTIDVDSVTKATLDDMRNQFSATATSIEYIEVITRTNKRPGIGDNIVRYRVRVTWLEE